MPYEEMPPGCSLFNQQRRKSGFWWTAWFWFTGLLAILARGRR